MPNDFPSLLEKQNNFILGGLFQVPKHTCRLPRSISKIRRAQKTAPDARPPWHFGSGALVAALFTLVSVETNGQPARPDGTQGSPRIGRDREGEVPWTCAQAEV
jgi:hypothetical protein